MDGGLEVARSTALRLFERIWAGAVDRGIGSGRRMRLTSTFIASRVCSTQGAYLRLPNLFPANDVIKRLMEEAR